MCDRLPGWFGWGVAMFLEVVIDLMVSIRNGRRPISVSFSFDENSAVKLARLTGSQKASSERTQPSPECLQVAGSFH